MILYRIVKKVLYREHSKDLVQLNPLYTIGLEGETYWWESIHSGGLMSIL